MKNIATFIILFLFCVVNVMAIDNICEDRVTPYYVCKVVTPSIYCSEYNYTMTNSSGDVVQFNNLTSFSLNTYYFNFSQNVGEYLIKLCDESTREIFVVEDEKMQFTQLISILVFWGIGLVLIILMHKYKDDATSPVYGFVGGTIFIIFGSIILFGFKVIDNSLVSLPFDINKSIGLLSMVVGLYCFWISNHLLKFHKTSGEKKDEY